MKYIKTISKIVILIYLDKKIFSHINSIPLNYCILYKEYIVYLHPFISAR